MLKYPVLEQTSIHTLMLDTTYSAPKWKFPPQSEAISIAADIVKKAREEKARFVRAPLWKHSRLPICFRQGHSERAKINTLV